MKRFIVGAAIAAAALVAVFFGLMIFNPAVAQTARDATSYEVVDEVQPGARLVAPGEDPVRMWETAKLTQYSNEAADGGIEIPYGDLIAELLVGLLGLAGIVAAWLLRRLPSTAVAALDMLARLWGQQNANEVLEKALGYGINTTAGAVRGKTLPVKVGNEVLERALEYAVRHAPGLIAKLGGINAFREKIIARLDLEADAAIPSPRPPAESLIVSRPASPAPAVP